MRFESLPGYSLKSHDTFNQEKTQCVSVYAATKTPTVVHHLRPQNIPESHLQYHHETGPISPIQICTMPLHRERDLNAT